MEILGTIFFIPFVNLLFFLYKILGSEMALAIIALTLSFKLITLPLNLRMLRSQRRMQQLKPQLDKLKAQHGQDKVALAQAQMELYKIEGVSPAGACLPMLLQLPFLFGLYAAFSYVVQSHTVADLNAMLYSSWLYIAGASDELISDALNLNFLGINLAHHADFSQGVIAALPYVILPILAAASQFILSKLMMAPKSVLPKPQDGTQVSLENSLMAAQGQMVYLFPIITLFINIQFAAGLSLYWTVGNIFSIIQQLYINKKMPIMAISDQGELVTVDQLEASNAIEGQIIEYTDRPKTKSKSSKKKSKKRK